MMNKNERTIIEKGFYTHPQKCEQIQLKQYIIAKEGNKRILLLRFYNESELIINGMEIILTEIKADGKESENIRLRLDGMNAHSGETFALKNGIVISDDCTDFTVEVKSIVSKDYLYIERNGILVPKYDPRFKSAPKKNRNAKITVKKKKVSSSISTAFIVTLGMIVFFIICVYFAEREFGMFEAMGNFPFTSL